MTVTLPRPEAMLRWATTCSIAGLLAVVTPAHATPTVEDEAVELLRAAVRHVSEAERFQVTLKTTMNSSGSGQHNNEPVNMERQATLELAVERPNRLALRAIEGFQKTTLISDGEKMIEYLAAFDRYVEYPAPPDVNAIFANDLGDNKIMSAIQVFSMVGPLLSSQQLASLEPMIREAAFGEVQVIDGEPVRHLRFLLHVAENETVLGMASVIQLDEPLEELTLDVWISEGETPMIRRMQPDLSAIVQKAAEDMPHLAELDIQIRYDFSDWRLNEPIDDEHFVFVPPASAKQASTTQEAIEESRAE